MGSGSISLATLQSNVGQRLCKQLNLPLDISSVVFIDNGVPYRRSGAVLRILYELENTFVSYLYVFLLVPEFIRDFGYTLFAINRYRLFGQYEQCRRLNAS